MSTRLRHVAWSHTAADLAELLRVERNDQRARRLRALLLLREGASLDEAAAAVEAAPRTVWRWLAIYRRHGLDQCLRRIRGHQARGRPCALSAEQRCLLTKRIEAHPFASIDEAIAWVADHCGVIYTYQGMYALLRRLKGQGRSASGPLSPRAVLPGRLDDRGESGGRGWDRLDCSPGPGGP
jgi:transposase